MNYPLILNLILWSIAFIKSVLLDLYFNYVPNTSADENYFKVILGSDPNPINQIKILLTKNPQHSSWPKPTSPAPSPNSFPRLPTASIESRCPVSSPHMCLTNPPCPYTLPYQDTDILVSITSLLVSRFSLKTCVRNYIKHLVCSVGNSNSH